MRNNNLSISRESLEQFDESWSLEEYRDLVIYSLMNYMSWPEFRDNYEKSAARVEWEESTLIWSYENHESPNNAAAEIGFGCG